MGAVGLATVGLFLPGSAQVPLKGPQPPIGSRREQRELITASTDLYSFSKDRSKAL